MARPFGKRVHTALKTVRISNRTLALIKSLQAKYNFQTLDETIFYLLVSSTNKPNHVYKPKINDDARTLLDNDKRLNKIIKSICAKYS
ncbi:MAG TPA: hypothetical protein VH500_06330 [Nitrososphaeraceae archaeon]